VGYSSLPLFCDQSAANPRQHRCLGYWILGPSATKRRKPMGVSLQICWIIDKKILRYPGFEILTTLFIKSSTFWNMTPCSPLKINRLNFQRTRKLCIPKYKTLVLPDSKSKFSEIQMPIQCNIFLVQINISMHSWHEMEGLKRCVSVHTPACSAPAFYAL
jgi:hypothetical protein